MGRSMIELCEESSNSTEVHGINGGGDAENK